MSICIDDCSWLHRDRLQHNSHSLHTCTNNKYSKQLHPYLSQSTIVRRAHISQGLTHPDAEIKSIHGNIPGIEKHHPSKLSWEC